MKFQYLFKSIGVFATCFLVVYGSYIASQSNNPPLAKQKEAQLSYSIHNTSTTYREKQNPYNNYGNRPTHQRIEIEVYDDRLQPEKEIVQVVFQGKDIMLTPSDPSGLRGVTYVQVVPGVYQLQWSIRDNSRPPPNITTYKENIKIDPDYKWIHIFIHGSEMKLSY